MSDFCCYFVAKLALSEYTYAMCVHNFHLRTCVRGQNECERFNVDRVLCRCRRCRDHAQHAYRDSTKLFVLNFKKKPFFLLKPFGVLCVCAGWRHCCQHTQISICCIVLVCDDSCKQKAKLLPESKRRQKQQQKNYNNEAIDTNG